MTRSLPIAIACCTLLSCVVTETGNPPLVERELLATNTTEATGAFVEGLPGAVSPAEGTVFIANLSEGAFSVDEPVNEDGSFSVRVSVTNGDLIRVHARNSEGLSEPIDFTWTDAGPTLPETPCLSRSPAGDLLFGESANITLENTCAESVTVEVTTSSRAAVEPRVIEPGMTAEISLLNPGDITVFGIGENGTVRSGITLAATP